MCGGLAIKLIRNVQCWRKRLLGNELFSRAQSTLTLQYSVLLSLFLLSFIVTVYLLLHALIWNDQEEKLNKLLDAEAKALQGPLYNEIMAGTFDKPGRRPFELSADQAYYYLVDPAGSLIAGAELQKELASQVMELIGDGSLNGEGLEQVQLQVYGEVSLSSSPGPLPLRSTSQESSSLQASPTSKSLTYLTGQRPIYRDGEWIATLYAGKDVTFQKQIFSWLLAALLGMFVLFLVLAAICSRWMSRQAMIPVRRAYERQQQFVADASHELRTPLSVMLASIETLDMERDSEDHSEEWVLEGLKEEIRRMSRLANDLLLLARSDTGEFVVQKTWFDMAETAAQAIARLSSLAEAQQVELSLECPPELIVYQDQDKLVQLIVIFLDNGMKYTLPGGRVTLKLSCEAAAFQPALRIQVRDTGIGIAPEELPRIFDRFYRPDKARSRQMGGHGLGLAIAKQIAEACGGTVHAASRLGEGSTFEAVLPLQEQPGSSA